MQYSIIGFVIAVMTGKFFLSQIYNILFDSNMLQENLREKKYLLEWDFSLYQR